MAADLNFSGKRVLIIGGSSGIGNGVAHAFRGRGADVAIWGTRPSASDYDGIEGSDLTGLGYAQVDVSDTKAVNAATDPFDQPIDVLVQCQGIVIYKRGEFDMGGFEKVVDLNLNSMMACSLRFKDQLVATGGSNILISSTAAFRTTFGNPAYNASKAAILGLTRALAVAWISEGVRVNGVAPGLVDTKLTKVMTAQPERLKAQLAHIPMGRMGLPEEIAGAVLFLASPLASYVVGQTIAVDGGGML